VVWLGRHAQGGKKRKRGGIGVCQWDANRSRCVGARGVMGAGRCTHDLRLVYSADSSPGGTLCVQSWRREFRNQIYLIGLSHSSASWRYYYASCVYSLCLVTIISCGCTKVLVHTANCLFIKVFTSGARTHTHQINKSLYILYIAYNTCVYFFLVLFLLRIKFCFWQSLVEHYQYRRTSALIVWGSSMRSDYHIRR